MTFYLGLLFQWLHVAAAITWVSAVLLVFWALPVILRQPAAQGQDFYANLNRGIKPVAIVAGQLTLICGLLRGTWLGPVQSWHALFATPYGLTFLSAIVLVVLLMAASGRFFSTLPDRVWQNGMVNPDAAAYVRRNAAVHGGLLALIVGCMVLMRYGL